MPLGCAGAGDNGLIILMETGCQGVGGEGGGGLQRTDPWKTLTHRRTL